EKSTNHGTRPQAHPRNDARLIVASLRLLIQRVASEGTSRIASTPPKKLTKLLTQLLRYLACRIELVVSQELFLLLTILIAELNQETEPLDKGPNHTNSHVHKCVDDC